MTRRLSIASGLSLLLHAGLAVWLALVFANLHRATVETLPVLSLRLSADEPGSIDTDSRQQTQETIQSVKANQLKDAALMPEMEFPGAEQPVAAANTLSRQGRLSQPSPVSVSVQAADTSGVQQPESEAVQANAVSSNPVVIETANTVARPIAAEAIQQPTPETETVALTRREKRMLNRKVRQWAVQVDKLSQAQPTIEWKHKGRSYIASFDRKPAADSTSLEQILITVSTNDGGQRLSTRMQMQRLAFSSFGQFVHRWDPNVQLHNDVIDGRFHSNSDVVLSYSRQIVPTFNGPVSIAGDNIRINESRGFVSREEMFRGGVQTGVRVIPLPRRFMAFTTEDAAGQQLHRFDQNSRIRLHADGSYTWQALTETTEQRSRISGDTLYLVADAGARLHLSGVTRGKVLVYSPEGIVIENDLLYADDPRASFESQDYLGLVSEEHVEIAEAEVTGPGDLEIQAAVYARKRFRVRGYHRGSTDMLSLYGSLTAGALSATEPRYRTRVEFDPRLNTSRPPAFPVTGRYELLEWDQQWQLDNE